MLAFSSRSYVRLAFVSRDPNMHFKMWGQLLRLTSAPSPLFQYPANKDPIKMLQSAPRPAGLCLCVRVQRSFRASQSQSDLFCKKCSRFLRDDSHMPPQYFWRVCWSDTLICSDIIIKKPLTTFIVKLSTSGGCVTFLFSGYNQSFPFERVSRKCWVVRALQSRLKVEALESDETVPWKYVLTSFSFFGYLVRRANNLWVSVRNLQLCIFSCLNICCWPYLCCVSLLWVIPPLLRHLC